MDFGKASSIILSDMKSLASLLSKLPKPTAQYAAPGAEFDVYCVKDLSRNHWNSPALKEILLLCRGSYSRYGDRPLLDEYDTKAAIYLVRARYPASFHAPFSMIPCPKIEEWLSVRIVPGDGKPLGVHEPEIFEWNGKTADALMQKKIGVRTGRDFWKQVAGSQRMCGIHPYWKKEKGKRKKEIGKRGFHFPFSKITFLKDPGHRYTAVCFALMHAQFVRDYPLKRFPYRYITSLIRSDYYKKGLAYIARGGGKSVRPVRPVFTSARAFLGLRRGGERVKRDVFSYQYPLYWFDAQRLLRLVNGLRRKARKPALQKLEPRMFYNISKEADRPTTIAGLRIAPARMRHLMDRLPDAPGLNITPAATWYRGMEALLKAAGVTIK